MSYTSLIDDVEKLHKKLLEAYPDFEFQPYVEPLPYDLCPKCQMGRLRTIHGRYGYFQGCSRYPSCTYTKHLN